MSAFGTSESGLQWLAIDLVFQLTDVLTSGLRVRWRPWAPATARIVAFIEAREGW